MRTVGRASFDALPGYNKLFADFMLRPERLAALYTWDFRNDGHWQQLASLRRLPHRDELARILVDQNRSWDAPETTLEAARQIGGNTTYVVTTGQQLALYGGCLFYFYKTITAILLARRLSSLLGTTVAPVFWMEGEDHDLPEVDHLVFHGDRTIRLDGLEPGREPIAGRKIPASIGAFHEAVLGALPSSEHAPALAERLAAAYSPGRRWVEAFARVWARLFPGLVLIDPTDPRIKRLAGPIFDAEMRRAERITGALDRRDTEIEQRGYSLQVRTGYPNFFWLKDGRRQPVRYEGGRFYLDEDGGEEITGTAVAADRFSPKVLLRPIVQDYVLPNLATIGGPGEIAYFAQAEALFSAHGVTPSVVYPRAAATILEKPALRILEGSRVPFEALAAGPASVFERLKPAHPEEALIAAAVDEVKGLAEGLRAIAAESDPTLLGAIDTAREKLSYQLTNLQGKFSRARYQREETLSKRIEAACAGCFPGGEPQERVIAGIYLLGRYGPSLLEELVRGLEIGVPFHQLLAFD